MALPSLSKTWQYSVNNALTAGATLEISFDQLLLGLKNALKGFGTNPWTVKGSANGAGAFGMDGVDRWSTDTNIVHAASANPKSWIVLEHPNVGTGSTVQICIELNSTTVSNATIAISPGGLFTGGTNIARPTATDETVVVSAASWLNGAASAFASVYHVLHSTDGTSTRVAVFIAGVNVLWWSFDYINGQMYLSMANAATNIAVTGTFYALSTKTWFRYSGTTYNAFWTADYGGATVVSALAVANEISTNWVMDPIGLVCVTAGARGHHGYLPDLYWGYSGQTAGTTYPNDTSRTWFQIASVIVPWNGTVPVTT